MPTRFAMACALTVALAAAPASGAAAVQGLAAESADSLVAELHALFDSAVQLADGDEDEGPDAEAADDDPEASYRRRAARLQDELVRLGTIDREALPEAERLNYDIFARLHRDAIREIEVRAHLMPFTTFVPFYASFADIGTDANLRSVEAYERYIGRLEGWPERIESTIALMRLGLDEGITLPRIIVEPVPGEIAVHIVDDPTESRLWAPFAAMPESFSSEDRARITEAGRAAIMDGVVAGYRAFHDFLAEDYVPGTRTSIGISETPGGRAFYEHRVQQFTTLDITPEAVHERGLAEVARIRGEMEGVIEEAGFEGTFAEFLEFLRTDPRFYAETEEELLMRNAYVLKLMDGQLPRLFGTLPRTPYGIREIPEHAAPRMTTAYYGSAPASGDAAGFYYINTYDLASRPLYEVTALSFHEAVPGHHLQRAIQIELGDVPGFRRRAGFTAYVEGWALYAERLGLEVGFYEDPYDDFGRLSYEMWRALRLVVDTGIHAFGWERQRAIDFMAENSALSLANITAEVDRYISWPGQALGYKMGEITIRDLRARAEERLGEAFDLRAFHDAVLGTGPVPLSVLEAEIERWIAEREGG